MVTSVLWAVEKAWYSSVDFSLGGNGGGGDCGVCGCVADGENHGWDCY